MRIRSRFLAALGVAALSLGGVLASATAASAAENPLTVHNVSYTDGDTTWSGGIPFSSPGWTPSALVDVHLEMRTADGGGDVFTEQFWTDAEGNLSGVLHPAPTLPPVFAGEDGSPRFEVWAIEQQLGGGGAVNISDRVPLFIAAAPVIPDPPDEDPTIWVPTIQYRPGDTGWDYGIEFTGSGWTTGETVVVTLIEEHADGTAETWPQEYVADADYGIFGVLTPPASMAPVAPDEDGFPKYRIVAVEPSTERESNTVQLIVSGPPVIVVPTISLPVTSFEQGDETWGGGIIVDGSGWTPGANVTVHLTRAAGPSAGESESYPVVADGDGRISAFLTPGLIPELPGPGGYPLFSVIAEESVDGGLATSNIVALTITESDDQEPPVYTPSIVVAPSFTIRELEEGLTIPYSGFGPGEGVQFTLYDGMRTILDTTTQPADESGAGSVDVTFDPATGEITLGGGGLRMLMLALADAGAQAMSPTADFTLTLEAVGAGSGAAAQASFLVVVAGDPVDPGSGTDAADGGAAELASTGAERDATVNAGGLAVCLVALGLALVVAANRRRLAGLIARR